MGFVANLLGIQSQNPDVKTLNYTAPLLNELGVANQGQNNQQQLVQALQAMAQGQGPNLAQTQLQGAQQQNAQQAAGLIGSEKGLNPGLAAQQVLRQYGMANQNAANQSAQLAQQQQLGALSQLGNVTNQQVTGANQGAGVIGNQLNAQNNMLTGNTQYNAGATQGVVGGGLNALGGAAASAAKFLSEGGMVDGKQEVPGDSPKNDNVPAMLSPGEIVVPKEVVEGRPEDAKAFIQAVKAHKGEADPQGYAKVLAAHRHLHERVSALEAGRKGSKK